MKRKKNIPWIYSEKVFYFITFLLFVGVFILISSCSNQKNISLRYKIEKNFYNSEKMRKVLSINLKAAAPADFKKVVQSYQEVVALASTQSGVPLEKDISDIAASAELRMAELYLLQKDFDSAQKSLENVLRKYPESRNQGENALLGLAQIYEKRNEKEKAVETYHQLLDNYPVIMKKNLPDPDIFSVPNHLIQLFSPKEEKAKRENEFEYAQKYFQNLIRNYPNTQVSLAATLSLAGAYQFQNLWKESIVILETAKDSTGQTPGSVLLQIGNIYYDYLKDEKNSLSTFSRVINSSPDPFSKAEAQMKIGMIYLQKKDYPKAKQELSRVQKLYPEADRFIATSQYLIAQIYENTAEWERALNEYNWLMVNYPLTPEGLEAPLKIAGYYLKENKALASESFEKGIEHYDQLLNKYKDKPFAVLMESQKAKLYTLQKEWDKAVSILLKIAEKNPGTEIGLNSLLNLVRIYKLELKDERKYEEILARIETEYPGIIPDTLVRR
ncbi:MAG: tetratricopeptide repeat protein [candidate division Zixibacteria bacterium]|nr:tetratricopeptide repeat protein [candidate division Zixibacteria bacterium]